MTLLVVVAALLAGALLLAVAYRALFTLASLLGPGHDAAGTPSRQRRFAVVIPAHDEELLIGDLIRSIRAADYPAGLLEVHVIADNCRDATGERARALGAQVAERRDPGHPGKGQAIAWMLQRLDLSGIDAVVLFDADNVVDPAFFQVMNRELERGWRCLQGYYGISNPDASTLTRLMAVTHVMKNELFNAGKARLGLSVLLMGTGMVFAREVLEEGGWQAMSIGEDLEQSFHLLLRGERIRFAADAVSLAQESTTLRQGYRQRQRWASGRRALAGRARLAIAEGLRRPSLELFDAGVDLLMPAYSKLMNWSIVAAALALIVWSHAPLLLLAVGIALAWQLLEILLGLRLLGANARFVASLAFAPVYLGWKAVVDLLALFGHRRDVWARTGRRPHPPAVDEGRR